MALNKAKDAMRKQLTATIKLIPHHEIARQSSIVCNKVLASAEYKKAFSVSVYLSMAYEVDTDIIVRNLFQTGKRCYVPRFRMGADEMEMVELASVDDYESLPTNKWGIRQPPCSQPRVNVFQAGELDLVLAPGLGFTVEGHRLGHGRGYYDRFLSSCHAIMGKAPRTLGLALTQQLMDRLPVTHEDHVMDQVIHPLS